MKRNTEVITHDQVQEALKRFSAKGGLLKRLPDQVTPVRQLVGGRWASLESLIDTIQPKVD
jgi:hypothetical protein